VGFAHGFLPHADQVEERSAERVRGEQVLAQARRHTQLSAGLIAIVV
jgi:hypothetical protein